MTANELESMREWKEGAVRIVEFDDGQAGKLDIGGVRWEPAAFESISRDFHPHELYRWARSGGIELLSAEFERYYSIKTRPRLGADDYGQFITLRR